ncbi:CmcI family methyltransferase [Aliikangiella marina]|nr:CmcI family methyltransferase [Aliikangiella marina]
MPDYLAKVKHTKWNYLKWKGLTLMKDPMSLSIYQQMLQDIKPKTILEFGTFEGGSALWMSDLLKSFSIDCDIHTFDINDDRVNLPNSENIFFHHLDNHKIIEYAEKNKTFFEQLKHPILAIEDSHENSSELLHVIDGYLTSGDYLVIEDTLSEWKHEMLEKFALNYNYLVDSHYCDFWGYNNSWNLNSFLKKI